MTDVIENECNLSWKREQIREKRQVAAESRKNELLRKQSWREQVKRDKLLESSEDTPVDNELLYDITDSAIGGPSPEASHTNQREYKRPTRKCKEVSQKLTANIIRKGKRPRIGNVDDPNSARENGISCIVNVVSDINECTTDFDINASVKFRSEKDVVYAVESLSKETQTTWQSDDNETGSQSSSDQEVVRLRRTLQLTILREAKLRRAVSKLQELVDELEDEKSRFNSSWRSKYYRLLKKNPLDPLEENVNIVEAQGPVEVRKRLLYCEALEQQLSDRQKLLIKQKDKIVFRRCVSGKILKKYKCMKDMTNLVSLKSQKKYADSLSLVNPISRPKRVAKRVQRNHAVRIFLERDENSALAPGVKDTITKNKVTKRKRYLQGTLDELYDKYNSQNSAVKMSRSTFYRAKPFWIVHRRMSDRDTCMCKTHSDMHFLIEKMRHLKWLDTVSSLSFQKLFVCDIDSRSCCYGTCDECRDKSVERLLMNRDINYDDLVAFFKWVTKKVSRLGAKELIYDVQITSKEKITCSIKDFIQEVNKTIPPYLQHVYLTTHQYKTLEIIRTSIEEGHVYLVNDFSQNYLLKFETAIQRSHFGASQKQASLHTGAFFYINPLTKEIVCVSFCTISECLRHDAVAIWAHLEPIMKLIRVEVPNWNTLHIQSDGPSTQYKNKTNLYLFKENCKELGLEYGSWNFTSPGHGKSTADGIGGNSKGLCDRAVLNGNDVHSVERMVEVINSSKTQKTKAFLITAAEMQEMDSKFSQLLPDKAVPNTTKISQVVWSRSNPDVLNLNSLSCSYCICNKLYEQPCQHFSLRPPTWCFEGRISSSKTERRQVVTMIRSGKNKDNPKISGTGPAVGARRSTRCKKK
ncbi:hypothetical protein QAD02_000170 [Eretmocerus hayati]|uniref:Uncharacterized protein n=1 Tax=Eretmocerus hayati TaxID=131215 RepID=A0ACC2NDC7_9HYME|nr:hypothetical protein QAD02_000170 [Eretmocerus hayati]